METLSPLTARPPPPVCLLMASRHCKAWLGGPAKVGDATPAYLIPQGSHQIGSLKITRRPASKYPLSFHLELPAQEQEPDGRNNRPHVLREAQSDVHVLRHRFRSKGQDPFRRVESASHLANPLYIFAGSMGAGAPDGPRSSRVVPGTPVGHKDVTAEARVSL